MLSTPKRVFETARREARGTEPLLCFAGKLLLCASSLTAVCHATSEDVMDVATWLQGLGLERHEAPFRDNLIDMDVVRELTENDLERLGLPLGDRRRVLKAVAGLPPPRPPRPRSSRLSCGAKPSDGLSQSSSAIWSVRPVLQPRSTPRTGATLSEAISMTPPRRLLNTADMSPRSLVTGSWRCSDIRRPRRMTRNARPALDSRSFARSRT